MFANDAHGRRIVVIGMTVLAMLAAAPAFAQKPMPSQTQQDPRRAPNAARITTEPNPDADKTGRDDPDRVDDSYQPKGVELGSFLLLPQLETDLTYNSNVFAQDRQAKHDLIARVAPEFRLRSRFTNHAINLTGRVEQFLFKQYKSDNHLDAQFAADGRFDIERTWELTGFTDNFRRSEDRGSPDEVGGKRPTRSYGTTNRIGTKFQEGRFTFIADAGAARRVFMDAETSNGIPINNGDRNRWEYSGEVRGSYEMFPGYAAVTAVQVNRRRYDSLVDDAGYNRSSQGYRIESGIGLDLSQLVRGDFLIGYLHQDYEDPRLNDPKGLAFRATLNWTPSRITVVVPSLERTVLETTQRNASSMVRSSLSLLVRHEYQRNIILTGTASLIHDEYDGTDRSNLQYEARGRVIYALAPEYYVGGEIGYRRRISDISGQEYQQTIVGLRFGVRL